MFEDRDYKKEAQAIYKELEQLNESDIGSEKFKELESKAYRLWGDHLKNVS